MVRYLRKCFTFCITLLLILSFYLFAIPVNNTRAAETITVGSDGDYQNIQDAINAAKENYNIFVKNGIYNENIVINKRIVLTGEDKDNTIIYNPDEDKDTLTVQSCSYVTISGFTVKQNSAAKAGWYGVLYLDDCDYCDVNNCIIQDGYIGIWLRSSSSNNDISDNVIKSNFRGIYVQSSNNNIFDNVIQSSNSRGIFVESSNNKFYYNDFLSNNEQAYDTGSNTWDNGYPSGGNKWDDYTGTDTNGDRIGDIPYLIPGGSNKDNYPLGYFVSTTAPTAIIDPITPNSAPEGQAVTFSGHGVGYIIDYSWRSSKDGPLSTEKTFSTSKLSVGTHVIYFKVKDDNNIWSEEVSINLIIYASSNNPPTAIIDSKSTDSAISGQTVTFIGHGVDSDGQITDYSWRSSKDGPLSTAPTFSTSTLSVGVHTIYFKVKDNGGFSSDEDFYIITVTSTSNEDNTPPVANPGGPYSVNANHTVTLDASKSYDVDNGDTLIFHWDFGDGQTGLGETVDHVYSSTGSYLVTLTAIDSYGERSTGTTSVNVIEGETSENNDTNSGNQNANDGKKDKWVIPGFEIIIILLSLVIIIIFKKLKKDF